MGWLSRTFKKCLSSLHSVLQLKNYISAIIIMNAVDAALTWYWVTHDIAEELNPIMSYALSTSPILFFGIKILLTGLGCFLLVRAASANPIARHIAAVLVGVYIAIMITHGTIASKVFF